MRNNSTDLTIERNYIQKWRFLMAEYEEVQAGRHKVFRRVGEFYAYHGTSSQTFRKYYNRYLQSKDDRDFLPQKRGPRWRARRISKDIEEQIVIYRQQGLNRYEIYALLQRDLTKAPSLSTIYRVFKRRGCNIMKPRMKEEKRKIIKERVGELGHIDLHQLPQDMFMLAPDKPHYVLALVDDFSRLAWAGVVENKKSLPVMFRAMEAINTLYAHYHVQFEEIMSDNGSEFASPSNKQEHPFERMLEELGIKHRYTRPYRPQTNGKVERFWRTLEDDVIDGTTFNDLLHFKNELFEYMIYYNELRPHQSLNGKTPKDYSASCHNNIKALP